MSPTSSPNPPPKEYIYKILPHDPPPPSPLPDALPVSALDARDGFIHASTSKQLLGTLRRFFSGNGDGDGEAVKGVWILRLGYEGLRSKGVIKWETPTNTTTNEFQEGYFPHIYNNLKIGKEEIDAIGEWKRRDDGEWCVEEWPFGEEDVPV